MDRRAAIAQVAAAARRLPAPRAPEAASAGFAPVTLRWKAPKGAKPAKYVVLRDGHAVATTTHRSYTDHKGKAGHTYRYAIAGGDGHRRRGRPPPRRRGRVPP